MQRGDSLDKRATELPPGTPYVVVEHEHELADALRMGAEQARTEHVFVSASDGWLDTTALDFLTDLAWDAELVYGTQARCEGEEPVSVRRAEAFCPNRLYQENYLPELFLTRRDSLLELGYGEGAWDYHRRLHAAGGRIKGVPEAVYARTGAYHDPSPAPVAPELKASFYYQATPGTAYWRCLLPARWLPGQAVFNYPDGHRDDNGEVVFPNHRGTAVFQFGGSQVHYVLIRTLQEQGVRVLLEVDDNYTQTQPHMRRAGWGKRIRDDVAFTIEGHLRTVGAVDGVTCTTELLARQYRKHAKQVFVCPNQVDPQDWPELAKPDDGVFRVGWFASRSHVDDAQLVARGLEWASAQPGVEVVMVGLGHEGGRPLFSFPFKHVPWSNDMGVYRRMIQQLDIGLAPVVGTPWAQCRSDLKILEYGMGATAPIVSDAPPYADWADGEYVLKARTPTEFLRQIQHLVRNRGRAREMGLALRERVLAERTVESNIDTWSTAINGSG